MGLIIGVDGGGTKSTYKVFSSSQKITREFTGASINFYSLGNERACLFFKEVLSKIISEFQEKISGICIGSSALGLHDNIEESHPFVQCIKSYTPNFRLVSDLYIGLKGVNSIPAIFLISGTGSMAIAENSSGELFSLGGWGHILGDQGSGYYIGLRGLREAIKSYEGLTDKTLLADLAMKFFSVPKMEQIIEKVYNPIIEKQVIARFAADVIISAEKKDAVSQKIIAESIEYLVKISLKLHDKVGGGKTALGVYGGCFQNSKYFYNLFSEKINKSTPNLNVKFPEYSPVDAALALALASKLAGEDIGRIKDIQ